jgi:hypothetical protein
VKNAACLAAAVLIVLAAKYLPDLPLLLVIGCGLAAVVLVVGFIRKGIRRDRLRAALIDAQEHP